MKSDHVLSKDVTIAAPIQCVEVGPEHRVKLMVTIEMEVDGRRKGEVLGALMASALPFLPKGTKGHVQIFEWEGRAIFQETPKQETSNG